MSERIDHVGEAHACEEAGLSIMRRHDLAPHMKAVMQFDLARLHATLALVEQQRIANLIALGMYTNADGSRAAQHAVTHVVDAYSVGINADIREGLRLS